MIGNLPGVLTIVMRDIEGQEYVMTAEQETPKVEVLWAKIIELINHINDLEEKLLAAEERGGQSNFADLPETFGGLNRGPELDPEININ